MSDKYSPYLAKIFSTKVFKELANSGQSDLLNNILIETGLSQKLNQAMSLRDLFDFTYQYLSNTYRNEYIYKNAITNKILLGRYSLNTAFMLTEFRTENSRADMVLLNGTSTVYEIKTEFDSFDRLQNQLESYKKVFDVINIIVSPKQVGKALEIVEKEVGVIQLSKQSTLQTVREGSSRKEAVSPEAIFDSLQKNEYCSIIKDKYDVVPDVPNTRLYKECKKLFCQLMPSEAHDIMVETLKKRNNCIALREFIREVPYSLKASALNINLSKREQSNFLKVLSNQYSFQ